MHLLVNSYILQRNMTLRQTWWSAHLFLHRHFVVVADGVLAQEVKLYYKVLTILVSVECYVLYTQRAAADCVCSIIILLITSPQG